ncbi:MAG: heavy metal translocating P-type ATPase metal-binding domain-containing protein [Ignavibacteriaceae bacterium]|nr:heavy metal translocating P-type ATPase metal-binding domain-containing protein [Ignavibacteriaceae bacterium]
MEVQEALICYHCGEECDTNNISLDEKNFCCEGCKMVYQVLNDNNLCNYYTYENHPGSTQKNTISKNKYEFLDDSEISNQLLDFSDTKLSTVTFFIPDMHCASCIWLLENLSRLNPAVQNSRVNFLSKKLSITFLTQEITLRKIAELLATIGYEPLISLEDLEKKSESTSHRKLYYKIGIAGFSFGNIMLLSFPEYLAIDASSEVLKQTFAYVILLLSLPVFFYCSWDYFESAYKGIKQKFINIDVPLAIGILALFGRSVYEVLMGYGPGYMDSFAGLIFFLLLGKIFQQKTFDVLNFERNYKSYFPISVTLSKGKEERIIPLSKLKVGDRLFIKNGELIPADSILFNGNGNIDYSFVTGESVLVNKTPGEKLFAGGKQVGSKIEIEVLKDVSQSYLTQLWNNFSFDKKNDAGITSFANSISKYFTVVILFIAVSAFVYWLSIDVDIATTVFIAVLIVACPCALALSTPFTLGNSLRIFSKNKFYAKNINIIEKLAKLDTIVFDKTGTITVQSEAGIEFIGVDLTFSEQQMVSTLTSNSTHPLSRQISNHLNIKSDLILEDFIEIPSQGIKATFNGNTIKIGSKDFVNSVSVKTKSHSEFGKANASIVYLSINDEVKGYYKISNVYREGISEMISSLTDKYEMYLLSGDNDSEKENLQKIFNDKSKLLFSQSPYDKLEFIKKLKSSGKKVLMVGDGLNDAGALSESNVGISIAEDITSFTPASDAILEASEFYRFNKFIDFSKKSLRIIYLSFGISVFYHIIGLGAAVQGMLSPLFAAVLMPLSSITVVVFTTLSTGFLAKRIKLL